MLHVAHADPLFARCAADSSTAPHALSDPLLPGYSGSVSSASSDAGGGGGGDGHGGNHDADGDAFFSDEGAAAAPSGAPSTISEDQVRPP